VLDRDGVWRVALCILQVRLERTAEVVERLPRLLRELTPAKLAEMRATLASVRAAFVWERDGLAYNLTILSLCRRAVELRGALKAGGGCNAAHAPHPTAASAPTSSSAASLRRMALAGEKPPVWWPPALVRVVERLKAERRARFARRVDAALKD
jgi:hypothetical protein